MRSRRLENQSREKNMFHIVLYEPEIPANTGNISRLSVAVGATLHLVGRLGFSLDDKYLKRAGLDYWPEVRLERHETLMEYEATQEVHRLFCFSSHATTSYTQVRYQPGDAFLFGCESRGLPPEVLERHAERALRIPMMNDKVRCLNLSSAVAIVVYEALRQVGALEGLPER